ncbi:MAG: dihydropteroate synthase [Bacteroidales bacterium]|nr:dihydropteroate synthase [Bacteroidales bacterium]
MELTSIGATRATSTPIVMGIINVNGESFYSGSRCCDLSSFSRQFDEMVAAGAGIIDIGACSTRPGSTPITLEEEWKLLEVPLRYLAECRGVIRGSAERRPKISIDTFRSEIVRRAYGIIGDFIVNDISAGEDDPLMLPTVGKLGLEYIAMHKRGTPDTMQQMCNYPNGVVREVAEYFLDFEKRAEDCGIADYIVDPGFGFAKTLEQNYELFMGMPQLMQLVGKRLLLVGISRKSMIYKPLGVTPEESLTATAALNLQALMLGADILRVHDVREAVQCVKLHSLLATDRI